MLRQTPGKVAMPVLGLGVRVYIARRLVQVLILPPPERLGVEQVKASFERNRKLLGLASGLRTHERIISEMTSSNTMGMGLIEPTSGFVSMGVTCVITLRTTAGLGSYDEKTFLIIMPVYTTQRHPRKSFTRVPSC